MSSYFDTVELFYNTKCNPCTMDELNKNPGDQPPWRLIRNKGDGHCFYHTVLRFIYDNNTYFQDHFLSFNNKPISSLIPSGYNPDSQKSSDVYELRKALIQSTLLTIEEKRVLIQPKDGDDESDDRCYNLKELGGNLTVKINEEGLFVNEFYLQALCDAKNDNSTSNWAGDCTTPGFDGEPNAFVGEKEFEKMAELLKICILVWQQNPLEGPNAPWRWAIYGSQSRSLDNDPNFYDKDVCSLTLFAINTGGGHFDTLIPDDSTLGTTTSSSSDSKEIKDIFKYSLSDESNNQPQKKKPHKKLNNFIKEMEDQGFTNELIENILDMTDGNLELARIILENKGGGYNKHKSSKKKKKKYYLYK